MNWIVCALRCSYRNISLLFIFRYRSDRPVTTRANLTRAKWCYIKENWQTTESPSPSLQSPCVTCSTPFMRLPAELWAFFSLRVRCWFGCFSVLKPVVQRNWLLLVRTRIPNLFLGMCADGTKILFHLPIKLYRRRFALDTLVDFTHHENPHVECE